MRNKHPFFSKRDQKHCADNTGTEWPAGNTASVCQTLWDCCLRKHTQVIFLMSLLEGGWVVVEVINCDLLTRTDRTALMERPKLSLESPPPSTHSQAFLFRNVGKGVYSTKPRRSKDSEVFRSVKRFGFDSQHVLENVCFSFEQLGLYVPACVSSLSISIWLAGWLASQLHLFDVACLIIKSVAHVMCSCYV